MDASRTTICFDPRPREGGDVAAGAGRAAVIQTLPAGCRVGRLAAKGHAAVRCKKYQNPEPPLASSAPARSVVGQSRRPFAAIRGEPGQNQPVMSLAGTGVLAKSVAGSA